MTTLYTVDEILSMDLIAAKVAYRELKIDLEYDYQFVGRHASRIHAHQVDRLLSAGGRHTEQADRIESEFQERCAGYRSGVHVKFLLAVWTGRFDDRLYTTRGPLISGNPSEQQDYQRVCQARRELAGIVLDPEREAREAIEAARENEIRLRQRARATELLAARGAIEAAAHADNMNLNVAPRATD